MKLIPLNRGLFAKVDDEDYNKLMKYRWYANKTHTKNKYIPTTHVTVSKNCRQKLVMHRFLLGVSDSKIFVDHINNDPLDNRKENLRFCSIEQNTKNRASSNNKTSTKYLGVCLMITKTKRFTKSGKFKIYTSKPVYSARIRSNKKAYYLGSFPFTKDGEIAAAKAYDEAAKKLHGEFANLNFKTT